MDAAPHAARIDVALDESGSIAGDLACLGCGYNLRGLNPGGVCPECGVAVGRSLHGELLRFSNPAWVEQLASGLRWIVASIVLMFVAMIVGAVANALGGGLTGGGQIIQELFVTGIGLVSLVGYWKVTTPEPGLQEAEGTASLRSVIRFTAVAGFVLSVMTLGAEQVGRTVAVLVSIVSGVNGLVMTFCVFVFARRLAMRIPDRHLADRTTVVMWGYIVCLGLALLVGLAALVGGAAGPAALLFGFTACLMGLGFVVFGLWALLLIDRYRRAFRDAANEARETWARETPAPESPTT